jgi:hypothetical protein
VEHTGEHFVWESVGGSKGVELGTERQERSLDGVDLFGDVALGLSAKFRVRGPFKLRVGSEARLDSVFPKDID